MNAFELVPMLKDRATSARGDARSAVELDVDQGIPIGTVLADKYRIEARIGSGGMAQVYAAIQLPLGRRVAVKVPRSRNNLPQFRHRFLLEASVSAKLAHRNIVTVHDFGETPTGLLYMAMEYLDGERLTDLISRSGSISPARACGIAIQVVRALRAAHDIGIVHRDLKPGNVMLLKEGEDDAVGDVVKVLDFGLLNVFEQTTGAAKDPQLTQPGTWVGSPWYMAPEQIRGFDVDPRTDIYALGVVLYHMVNGRPPFIGANAVEVVEQHLHDSTPPMLRPDVPPELELIIQRCMEKVPEDRYSSGGDLNVDLKACFRLISGELLEDSQGGAARARSRSHRVESLPFGDPGTFESLEIPRIVPPKRTRPWTWIAAAGAIAAGVIIGAAINLSMPARTDAPTPAHTEGILREAPAPNRTKVRVRLASSPTNATVTSKGSVLGKTPLEVEVDKNAYGGGAVFEFHLDGYRDGVMETALEGDVVSLNAALLRIPEPEAKRESKSARSTPRLRPTQPRTASPAKQTIDKRRLDDAPKSRVVTDRKIPVVDDLPTIE
jgi:serine/threonine-protein kinase